MKPSQELLAGLQAGCSAVSWSTQEGKHLWGRNFDFNRLAQGSAITFVPAGTQYYTCGNSLENNQVEATRCKAAYAAVGMGLALAPTTPILYEGVNEKGLMGGQLYYREFAHFVDAVRPGTQPLQPPLMVYHLLAQCANVAEVVRMLESEVTLIAAPMLGTVPTLHWSFSDRTGETIVIEPDESGLHIYRNTIGVMTNSPSYAWHRQNLFNYAGLRALDYDGVEVEGDRQAQCFSGSGLQGLPGDFSSPSRFVRLAFLKKLCIRGKEEEEGVARMLHLFQSAAFPLGAVEVSESGHLTKLDTEVLPYDYTVYTSVMCAESKRYYWTSYENQRVQYVDLHHLAQRGEPAQFSLGRVPDFLCLTRAH